GKTVTVADKLKSSISISKKDINGNDIDKNDNSATFELSVKTEGLTLEGVTAGGETDENGDNVIAFTGNAADIVGLKDGTYKLKETAAPTGYVTVSEFEFTIKDGKVDTSKTVTVTNGEVELTESGIVVKDKQQIVISKKELGANNTAVDLPKGATDAEFVLSVADGNTATLEGVTVGTETGIKDQTSITFTGNDTTIIGLKDGTYTLQETVAPDGYTVVSTFKFTVTNGKVDKNSITAATDGETVETVTSDGITITIADKVSEIEIGKQAVTGNTEVEGATLTLTNASVTEDKWDAIVTANTGLTAIANGVKWTSGSTAQTIKGLPDGDYTLAETGGTFTFNEVKYSVIDTTLSFTIENGEIVSDSVVTADGSAVKSKKEDAAKGYYLYNGTSDQNRIVVCDAVAPAAVEISKVEIGKTDELDGAKLQITGGPTDIDWTKVTGTKDGDDTFELTSVTGGGVEWTSGGNSVQISGLPNGNYTLTEITAPEGYVKAEFIDFTVENGKIKVNGEVDADSKLVMEDDYTKVTISKVDADDTSKLLEKAKLAIYKAADCDKDTLQPNEGARAVAEWTTDGTVKTIEKLPLGDYVLVELSAPENYQIAAPKPFSLKEGVTGEGADAVKNYQLALVMADTLKGKVSVTISKIAINGTEELKDAHLQILDKDNNVVQNDAGEKMEWISDGINQKTVSLMPGTYTLKETQAPDGYLIAEEITFVVTDDGKVTIDSKEQANNTVVMADDYTKVEISKVHIVDESTTKLIGDAELAVYKAEDYDTANNKPKDDAKAVESWTSVENEVHTIHALAGGDYYLVETSAPDGYTMAEAVKFTVDGTTKEIQKVRMADDISEIVIQKQDIDATGSDLLPGATMQLIALDETVDLTNIHIDGTDRIDHPTQNKHIITWKSTTGSDTIEMLPDGEYTLKETAAPDGYTVVSEFTFTIADGKISTSDTNSDSVTRDGDTITVKDRMTEVQVGKKDISGQNEVAGATLTLTGTPTDTAAAIDWDAIVKANTGLTAITNGVQWTSGSTEQTIKGLPTGVTYTLKETASSEGKTTFKDTEDGTIYEIVESAMTFEIGSDGKITNVTGSQDTYEAKDSDINESGQSGYFYYDSISTKPNCVEVCDARYTTVVKISKQDINETEEIEGAHLKITDEDGNVVEEWDSEKDTQHEVTLLPGTYTLEETTAPDGYVKAEEITFTVNEDGTIEEFEDGTVIMKDDYTKVEISKLDENDELLSGATLAIYQYDIEKKIAIGDPIEQWTSGTDPKVIEKLPLGDYVLVELSAPENYQIAEPVPFSLEEGVTGEGTDAEKNYQVSVTMKDAPKGSVIISKVAVFKAAGISETKHVEGAKLQILDTEGNVVIIDDKACEWTSDGTDQSFKLDSGTYTLHEESAPGGYLVASDITFKVSVAQDGTVQVTVDNEIQANNTVVMTDDYTKVQISKVDITDSTPLSGAVLEVYKASDDNNEVIGDAIESWETDGTAHEIDALAPGNYVLVEITAPDGYTIAEAVPFTVTETGEIVLVEMKDSKSVIQINKTDMGGKVITTDNAQFTLSGDVSLKDVIFKNVVTSEEGAEEITYGNKTAEDVTTFSYEGNKVEITGLKDGEYTLEETAAPGGYAVVSTFTFEVENGIVKTADTSVITSGAVEVSEDGKTITVKDEDIITITKKVLDTEDTVSDVPENAGDATFELTGEDLGGVKIGETTVEEGQTTVEFTGNETEISGLKDGTYTLKETVAPDGYTVVTEFTFTVENGKVTSVDTETNGAVETSEDGKTIIVKDDISTISINKTDMGGNEITTGDATFVLSVDTESNDVTLEGVIVGTQTGAEGETSIEFTGNDTTITGLKDGIYTLEETAAPDGYAVVSTFTFEIENGIVKTADTSVITSGAVEVSEDGKTITVKDEDIITITKKVLDTEDTVSDVPENAGDATFELTGEDLGGVKIGETTVEEGQTTVEFTGNETEISGLKDGTYTLKETVAPDGYTVVTEFTFTVENGKVTSVDTETNGAVETSEDGKTIIVKDDISTISINKTDMGGNEITTGEATFVLSGSNLDSVTIEGVTPTEQTADTIEYTGNGATFIGLKDGTYTLEETVAPDGYLVVSEFQFTVENGVVTSTSIVTNGAVEYTSDSIKVLDKAENEILISKKGLDSQDTLVEIPAGAGDASFTLTGNLDGVQIGSWTGTADDTSYSFTGNNTGIIGLKDGETYTLKEEAAPGGYAVVSEFSFTMEGGKVTNVTAVTSGDVAVADDGTTLIVKDDMHVLNINKTDMGGNTITSGDATFTLTGDLAGARINGGDFLTEGTTEQTFTGNEILIEALRDGTYTLEEITAPDGYETISAFTFEIENGQVKADSITAESTGDIEKYVTAEGTTLTVKNARNFTISKQDMATGEEIAGAKMVLTAEDTTADLSQVTLTGGEKTDLPNQPNTIVWLADGSTTLTNLPDGTYTLQETIAPDGYTIPVVSEFKFTITDGKVTASDTNENFQASGSAIIVKDSISNIQINKTDMGGEIITTGNATFTLSTDGDVTLNGVTIGDTKLGMNADGTISDTAVTKHTFTGNDVTITGLKDGTYTLEEIVAPEGYETISKFTFTVENGAVKTDSIQSET
ncbi:MAG: SpaA isopeptide-forming pilin-related protein, partial [Ruminococcus sp.]